MKCITCKYVLLPYCVLPLLPCGAFVLKHFSRFSLFSLFPCVEIKTHTKKHISFFFSLVWLPKINKPTPVFYPTQPRPLGCFHFFAVCVIIRILAPCSLSFLVLARTSWVVYSAPSFARWGRQRRGGDPYSLQHKDFQLFFVRKILFSTVYTHLTAQLTVLYSSIKREFIAVHDFFGGGGKSSHMKMSHQCVLHICGSKHILNIPGQLCTYTRNSSAIHTVRHNLIYYSTN